MNIRILHAAATALAVILALQPAGGLAQGVPTIDLTSIAKIGEVLTEAKLQVREMIASTIAGT